VRSHAEEVVGGWTVSLPQLLCFGLTPCAARDHAKIPMDGPDQMVTFGCGMSDEELAHELAVHAAAGGSASCT
jgi:hypothetical protein